MSVFWVRNIFISRLHQHSRELDLYRGLSFTTISSTGPNGGMLPIHHTDPKHFLTKHRSYYSLLTRSSRLCRYQARSGGSHLIYNDETLKSIRQIYLCDSGGSIIVKYGRPHAKYFVSSISRRDHRCHSNLGIFACLMMVNAFTDRITSISERPQTKRRGPLLGFFRAILPLIPQSFRLVQQVCEKVLFLLNYY